MKIPVETLKNYVSFNWNINLLSEKLTFAGFEVEGKEKINIEDEEIQVIDLKVTANRGDCLSFIGLAREIVALGGKWENNVIEKLSEEKNKYKFIKNNSTAGLPLEIKIEDYNNCSRYSCLIVEDVKVNFSPNWLKKILIASGIRPINNLVDITNLVLLELGQPMHAFDLEKISGKKIIVKTLKKEEGFILLDEQPRKLPVGSLMIADEKKLLALAGIMGGLPSSIKQDTKKVLLESANFNAGIINKTSRKIALKTESSYRFERNLDKELTILGLIKAAILIKELNAGQPQLIIYDSYDRLNAIVEETKYIDLSFTKLNNLLGENLEKNEIKNILCSLDFKLRYTATGFEVEVPSFRKDINLTEDLIEEIARIKGYNSFKDEPPKVTLLKPKLNSSFSLEKKIRNIFLSMGFDEAITHSLQSEKYLQNFYVNLNNKISVRNALSEENSVLRPSLVPGLLLSVQRNIRRQAKDLAFFEYGNTFRKENNQHCENKKIAAVGLGNIFKNKWKLESKIFNFDFYYFKGIIEELLREFKADIKISKNTLETEYPDFSDEIFTVTLNNNFLGVIGSLSKNIMNLLELPDNILVLELNADELLSLKPPNMVFKNLENILPVKREISLIIKNNILAEDIIKSIYEVKCNYLKSANIFDVYFGKNLPEGSNALGIELSFSKGNITLTDKEIDEVFWNIITKLKNEFNATLR